MNLVYQGKAGWYFMTDEGEQGPYGTESEAIQAFRSYVKDCPTCEE